MEQLTGLVVCGGSSTRMGIDKSLISWQGIAQRYFLYQMLEPLCKMVFISCKKAQSPGIESAYNYIVDNEKYNDIGPMAALLTAFNKYPGDSFLVLGCDYPFIKEEDILQSISKRNENDLAVSFFNKTSGFYEPLLTVYENKIATTLFENFNRQEYSLQHILRTSGAGKVIPVQMNTIKSVDTPEEYLIAVEEMKKYTTS